MKNILVGIAGLLLLSGVAIVAIRANPTDLAAESGRPLAWGVIVVIGGIVSLTAMQMVTAVQHQTWKIAWKSSLHGLSWSPLLLAIALFALLLVRSLAPSLPTNQVVIVVIPLGIGVQSAFLLSPDDEPMIELELAASRPFVWVLVERLLALFAVQSSIALLGTVATVIIDSNGKGIIDLIMQWLPPAILLSGVALTVTLATRQPALSAFMVLSLLFTTLMFGDLAVQRWPFTWFLNPYAVPASYGYALNRIVISLIGFGLIIRAAHTLNDPERLLSNARQSDQ